MHVGVGVIKKWVPHVKRHFQMYIIFERQIARNYNFAKNICRYIQSWEDIMSKLNSPFSYDSPGP